MRWKYLARTNTVRREDRLGVAAEDLSPELRAAGERLRAASRPVPRDPAFTARLRAELLLAHRGRALPPPRHLRLPRRSRRLVLLAALMASFGGGIAAARVLAPAPAPGTVLPGVTPLVRTVFVGQTVGTLAVDGRTGRAFVVARSEPIRGSVPQMVVRMLDTTTGALLRTVVLGTAGGIGTSVMAVDQRTGRVFVAHEERMGGESSAVVSVLDARSGAVLRQTHLSSRMTVGMPPGPALSQPELAIDERIGRAFLTSNETDTVSVFDAASGALRGAIGVGRAPHALAIDARRGRVVVANGSAMTVSILDAVTGHVLRTADVGGCPNAVAIDERTGHAFVTLGYAANRRRATTQDAGRVAVLAIQTGQVLATVAVLGTPHAVTVAGAARHVFVGGATFSGAGRVSMLDAATGRVLRTSVVGAYPTALVSAVGGERVVVTTVVRPGAVTALSDSVVSVLDAHSGRVVRVVRASLGLLSPGAVAVDDRTGQVFIANEDTVSVLTVGR